MSFIEWILWLKIYINLLHASLAFTNVFLELFNIFQQQDQQFLKLVLHFFD